MKLCLTQIDDYLRFMILMDGVHPEMDTCIIVDYKGVILNKINIPGVKVSLIRTLNSLLIAGHMILNTVDCTRPNAGRLPQNVDLMMTDFAGGASGFPMTFYGGKYSGKAEFPD